MSETSPRPERLVRALTVARDQRYTEIPGDESPVTDPTALQGRCPRNAHVLATVLENHGFDPVVICGGVTDEPVEPDGTRQCELPMTIRECEERGNIHYWVETRLRTYTLDLASEIPVDSCRGKPFIARSVPANYYYLEDGVGYTFKPVPQ